MIAGGEVDPRRTTANYIDHSNPDVWASPRSQAAAGTGEIVAPQALSLV